MPPSRPPRPPRPPPPPPLPVAMEMRSCGEMPNFSSSPACPSTVRGAPPASGGPAPAGADWLPCRACGRPRRTCWRRCWPPPAPPTCCSPGGTTGWSHRSCPARLVPGRWAVVSSSWSSAGLVAVPRTRRVGGLAAAAPVRGSLPRQPLDGAGAGRRPALGGPGPTAAAGAPGALGAAGRREIVVHRPAGSSGREVTGRSPPGSQGHAGTVPTRGTAARTGALDGPLTGP